MCVYRAGFVGFEAVVLADADGVFALNFDL